MAARRVGFYGVLGSGNLGNDGSLEAVLEFLRERHPGVQLGFMAMGGRGCISVTANVAPRLCADFQDACLRGDWARALELQDRLFPLHVAMFSDASPGPVKYALNRVRPDMPTDVRLPLTSPSDASRRAVDAALEHAGLV